MKETRLVGTVRKVGNKKEITNYVIYQSYNEIRFIKAEDIQKAFRNINICNLTIDKQGKVECKDAFISKLPIFNLQGEVIDNKGLYLYNVVRVQGSRQFEILDFTKYLNGKQLVMKTSFEKSVLASGTPLINASIVYKKEKPYIKAHKGSFIC